MNDTADLIERLGEFAYSPYAFVMWAFPWGEAGTELANETGPDKWQTAFLKRIEKECVNPTEAVQLAVTSGHGVGKSALVAWIIWWAFSTYPQTRGVVTANTENQLRTKTWVEIAKWHRLFIARDLFKCKATALFSVDKALEREWRIDVVPWSEQNTEAFAGLHNAGKRLIIIFDEASAIPAVIWETTEGALTDADTEILWCVFGNPTRSEGRFRECFPGGKFTHRWGTFKVDSRDVKRTNKKQLESWIADYGIDSDFVRVRILGEFPKGSLASFISFDLFKDATKRRPAGEGPVFLGVDVARFGNDSSVLWPRQGLDAYSRPVRVFSGISTTELVEHILRACTEFNVAALFVDGTGVGGGVVDQCRALGLKVFDVQFGAKPSTSAGPKYANKRAEIWGGMRDWLALGGIPENISSLDLQADFCTTEYTVNDKGLIILESKSMMRTRGRQSPDAADALACTFAFPYTGSNLRTARFPVKLPEYNPFERIHDAYL